MDRKVNWLTRILTIWLLTFITIPIIGCAGEEETPTNEDENSEIVVPEDPSSTKVPTP